MNAQETNLRTLERYQEKLKLARKRMDRSFRRLGIAMNVAIRARNKITYLEGQIEAVNEAIVSGEAFRKPRQKKAKGIRAIEL